MKQNKNSINNRMIETFCDFLHKVEIVTFREFILSWDVKWKDIF